MQALSICWLGIEPRPGLAPESSETAQLSEAQSSCIGPHRLSVRTNYQCDLPPERRCTCVGPDQLFVRVHDAVRHCEDAEAGLAGAVNGLSHQQNGSSGHHIEEAKELLLPRSSIDCV